MIDISPYPNIRPITAVDLSSDNFFAEHEQMLEGILGKGHGLKAAGFDVLDYAPIAAGICLIDVERSPERFRYRFIGSDIATLYGKDHTGQYVDAIADELGSSYDETLALLHAISHDHLTLRHSTTFDFVGRGHVRVEAIDFPMYDDAGLVTQILCVVMFDQ